MEPNKNGGVSVHMPDFFDASAYRPADLIFHGRRAGADCMFRRTFGNLIFSDVECRAMADGAGVLAGFACGGLPARRDTRDLDAACGRIYGAGEPGFEPEP